MNAFKVVRYIKLHNSRLYGRLYKMVTGSGRRNFNVLASLDAEQLKTPVPWTPDKFSLMGTLIPNLLTCVSFRTVAEIVYNCCICE